MDFNGLRLCAKSRFYSLKYHWSHLLPKYRVSAVMVFIKTFYSDIRRWINERLQNM